MASAAASQLDLSPRTLTFLSWLKSCGFTNSTQLEVCQYGEFGRGIRCTRNFTPEDLVISSLPLKCCMLPSRLRADSPDLYGHFQVDDECLIVALILELAKGAESFWAPYFAMLPTDYSNIPFLDNGFLDAVQDHLPQSFVKLISDVQYDLHATYQQMKRIIKVNNLEIDIGGERSGDFDWAYVVVNSRAMDPNPLNEPNGVSDTTSLIPFMDLINHGTDSIATIRTDAGTGLFQLMTHNEIHEGAQVGVNYDANAGNREFYVNYGFHTVEVVDDEEEEVEEGHELGQSQDPGRSQDLRCDLQPVDDGDSVRGQDPIEGVLDSVQNQLAACCLDSVDDQGTVRGQVLHVIHDPLALRIIPSPLDFIEFTYAQLVIALKQGCSLNQHFHLIERIDQRLVNRLEVPMVDPTAEHFRIFWPFDLIKCKRVVEFKCDDGSFEVRDSSGRILLENPYEWDTKWEAQLELVLRSLAVEQWNLDGPEESVENVPALEHDKDYINYLNLKASLLKGLLHLEYGLEGEDEMTPKWIHEYMRSNVAQLSVSAQHRAQLGAILRNELGLMLYYCKMIRELM